MTDVSKIPETKADNEGINRTTAYNIISTFLVQGITFLTIPVFTRVLGSDQYGTYSVIYSWVILLGGVLDCGVGSTIGTGRYRFSGEYEAFRTGILKMILLFGTVTSVLLFLLSLIFPAIWDCSPVMMIMILAMSLGRAVVLYQQSCYIYEKKAKKNLILSLILVGSTVALSLIGVFLMDPSERYVGKVAGEMIPYVTIALVISIVVLVRYPAKWKKEHVRFALVVGFPIVFHELARNVLNQADRVMMRWMDQPESEIGIYSLFFSLASVLNVVLLALNNSWCPFYYDDLNEEKTEDLKRKTKNYVELFSVLMVGFLLVSREVGYLMADESYYGGMDILPVFVAAVFFIFVYMFYVNAEFFYRKTIVIAVGSAMAAVVNIVLNYLMIGRYGMYGAAIATTISYAALALFHFICLKRIRKNFYLKVAAFLPGILSLGIGVAAFYLLADLWVIRWLLAALVGAFELYRLFKRKTIF